MWLKRQNQGDAPGAACEPHRAHSPRVSHVSVITRAAPGEAPDKLPEATPRGALLSTDLRWFSVHYIHALLKAPSTLDGLRPHRV